jgi:hypothetical protein
LKLIDRDLEMESTIRSGVSSCDMSKQTSDTSWTTYSEFSLEAEYEAETLLGKLNDNLLEVTGSSASR